MIGPLVTSEDSGDLRAKTEKALSEAPAVVVGSGMLSKNRVGGVDPGWVGDLARLADVVLVEADGSRRRPIKGTADHEPAFPDAATLVVAVGNVHALGTPVDEEHVHRPAIFSDLTGIAQGQSITPRAFALAVAQGSLARVPQRARTVALITGVEPTPLSSPASSGASASGTSSLPLSPPNHRSESGSHRLLRPAAPTPTAARAQREEHLRWTLRAEPHGPAPPREPADSSLGVAVRAFGRGAISGTRGGPRPLAGSSWRGRDTALRPQGPRARLERSSGAPVGADGALRGGHSPPRFWRTALPLLLYARRSGPPHPRRTASLLQTVTLAPAVN
jgi:probable selenium-dependent hydroxylase accessory protein YqeC